jgi:hypothetical protein
MTVLQFPRKRQDSHPVTLLPLSLQYVSGNRQPKVYDNEARARVLRWFWPHDRHNAFDWQGLRR